jgi:predicted nucleic acid-binding Zn ribbon protein
VASARDRRRGSGESDPKPIGDLLRTLVSGRGWNERMALGRLRDAWADVVGANVAARCVPVGLSRGVLAVKADGGAWATELTLLARSIAQKADSFLGGGAVREVKVSAGGPLQTRSPEAP